jgi:hypothetical protein
VEQDVIIADRAATRTRIIIVFLIFWVFIIKNIAWYTGTITRKFRGTDEKYRKISKG